jgi:hypothetical protein
MNTKNYDRMVIARRGKTVSPELMREADLIVVGDGGSYSVTKDRYDVRREIGERELDDLIAESKVVTRI